jgi:hypothetical protein
LAAALSAEQFAQSFVLHARVAGDGLAIQGLGLLRLTGCIQRSHGDQGMRRNCLVEQRHGRIVCSRIHQCGGHRCCLFTVEDVRMSLQVRHSSHRIAATNQFENDYFGKRARRGRPEGLGQTVE